MVTEVVQCLAIELLMVSVVVTMFGPLICEKHNNVVNMIHSSDELTLVNCSRQSNNCCHFCKGLFLWSEESLVE